MLREAFRLRNTKPVHQNPSFEVHHAVMSERHRIGRPSSHRRFPAMQRDPERVALRQVGDEAGQGRCWGQELVRRDPLPLARVYDILQKCFLAKKPPDLQK